MSSRATDGLLSIAMTNNSEFTIPERKAALQRLDTEGLIRFLKEFDWEKNYYLYSVAIDLFPIWDSLPDALVDKIRMFCSAESDAKKGLVCRRTDRLLSIAINNENDFTVVERMEAVRRLDDEGLLRFLTEFDWMKNPNLFAEAFERYPDPDSLPESVQDKWQALGTAKLLARTQLERLGSE